MIIETERLILRPFNVSDAADVYEYLHEPQVNCFLDLKLDSYDDAVSEMERRSAEQSYYFAVVLKDSGKVIGEVFAYPETGEPQWFESLPKDMFSPCIMFNRDYRGNGYAYETSVAFFNYLFEKCAARRIYSYVDDYNSPSIRLCEKMGMRREGLFVEFVSFVNNPDGTPKYENTYQYAILRKEWDKVRLSKEISTVLSHVSYR